MKLAWGRHVSSGFRDRIISICDGFHWDVPLRSDLMSCIAWESGETFSPSIVNKAGSGATGLIQFMPTTAIGLGTTTAQLARLTAEEQLEFVQKYFQPYAHKIFNLPDMYMAILLPKYIGYPNDTPLFTGGTIAYRQNSGLDINTDGKVTKEEASAKVAAKLTKGLLSEHAFEME